MGQAVVTATVENRNILVGVEMGARGQVPLG